MNQLISERTDSCHCIVNLNQNVIEHILEERPGLEIGRIKEKLSKELEFNSKQLLEQSLNLSMKFQLNEAKPIKGKIIQQKKWSSMLTKNYEDYRSGLTKNRFSTIDSICNMKVCFITKPVFNKDFSIAAVYIDELFGLPPTFYSLYKKKNEEWTLFYTN